MKTIFTLLGSCLFYQGLFGQGIENFHDFNWPDINGDTISMSQYLGKKVMVVNVASYCYYTPEYTPLQQLYDEYKAYNFVVIGFPSDDFGDQGGTDSAIVSTCTSYDVSFPIMAKVHIITGDTAPIYKWLQHKELNGVQTDTVTWNFNKFLIDETGHWVRHFDSPVNPLDTAITNWILSPSVLPAPPYFLQYFAPVIRILDTLCNVSSFSQCLRVIDPARDSVTFQLSKPPLYGSANLSDYYGNVCIDYQVTDSLAGIDSFSVMACSRSGLCGVLNITNLLSPVTAISLSGSNNICQGDSVTLTAADGFIYAWSNASANQSVTIALSGNYTVTVSNAVGCSAVSQPVVITVNSLPEVTWNNPVDTLINSTPVILTGGDPAGGVYSGPGVSDGEFYPAAAGNGRQTISYTYIDANGCSSSASRNYVVENATGINVVNEEITLELFPNPVMDELTVRSKWLANKAPVIYNVTGQIQTVLYFLQVDKIVFNTASLLPGAYTVKLDVQGEQVVKSFIKTE